MCGSPPSRLNVSDPFEYMNRLVSFIIPTYNYSAFVRDAVESALLQTYKPVEVIVVDDGSTDDTKEVLSDYIDTGEIKYLYQNNKGLAGARNRGLAEAKGEYIVFLDSDDVVDEKKLEIQVKCLEENPLYSFCFSDFRFFEGEDFLNGTPPSFKYPVEMTFRDLVSGKFLPVHTLLMRRDVLDRIGYFDESLRVCEDSDLWIRAFMAGMRFLYVDQVLAYYRRHGSQMVKDSVRVTRTFIEVINRYRSFDEQGAEMATLKWEQFIGRELIYDNRIQEGRKYLWDYMVNRRNNVLRNLVILLMSYLFSGSTTRRLTE